jgi:hypothetical protein
MPESQPGTAGAALRHEPRWPVALSIATIVLALAALPGRIRLLPSPLNAVLALSVLAPIAAVIFTRASAFWPRVERVVTLAFVGVGLFGTLKGLGIVLRDVIGKTAPMGGLSLLSSSVALWGLNVLIFSLLFWQLDRGGPAGRSARQPRRPDWSFPQSQAPIEEVSPDWAPAYPDYLFLAFSTATAFSTTDVLPLTTRAKMLMMAEALISLTTLALVASRAINILGS